MPNPISTTSPSACDPSLATCADVPADVPAPGAARPAAVSLDPVVVTGDAGAQALLRSYDAGQACNMQQKTATLACLAIPVAVVDNGLASAYLASVNCGKELRALSDCRDEASALQSAASQVIDDCHDRGGNVSAGASRNEIICEVPR